MRAFFVLPSSSEESIKIQGTNSRYARWKQRGSTKVLKAAIDAVKLATACAQVRPLVIFLDYIFKLCITKGK